MIGFGCILGFFVSIPVTTPVPYFTHFHRHRNQHSLSRNTTGIKFLFSNEQKLWPMFSFTLKQAVMSNEKSIPTNLFFSNVIVLPVTKNNWVRLRAFWVFMELFQNGKNGTLIVRLLPSIHHSQNFKSILST